MRTCIILSLLVILTITEGCASSARTYRSHPENSGCPYTWQLNLRGGEEVLLDDLDQIQVSTNAVAITAAPNRRIVPIEDVVSILRMDTKNHPGTIAGLAVIGSLVGAVLESALSASKTKYAGRGFITGGISGAALGIMIESDASARISDLSTLTAEYKFRELLALKRQHTSGRTNASRAHRVKIVNRDGSAIEGDVVLLVDNDVIVVQTPEGEVTVPWSDIRSFEEAWK